MRVQSIVAALALAQVGLAGRRCSSITPGTSSFPSPTATVSASISVPDVPTTTLATATVSASVVDILTTSSAVTDDAGVTTTSSTTTTSFTSTKTISPIRTDSPNFIIKGSSSGSTLNGGTIMIYRYDYDTVRYLPDSGGFFCVMTVESETGRLRTGVSIDFDGGTAFGYLVAQLSTTSTAQRIVTVKMGAGEELPAGYSHIVCDEIAADRQTLNCRQEGTSLTRFFPSGENLEISDASVEHSATFELYAEFFSVGIN